MGSESDSKAPLFWLDALSAISYVYVLPCSKYCLMCRYSWKPFNEELVPPRMIIGRILRYFPNFLLFQQTHGKCKDRCVLLVGMLGVTSEGGVLITNWWEHLQQLQTRIEAIEPHPMHIRSLCAGLTPLLTSAPMVNIIRWPVIDK